MHFCNVKCFQLKGVRSLDPLTMGTTAGPRYRLMLRARQISPPRFSEEVYAFGADSHGLKKSHRPRCHLGQGRRQVQQSGVDNIGGVWGRASPPSQGRVWDRQCPSPSHNHYLNSADLHQSQEHPLDKVGGHVHPGPA